MAVQTAINPASPPALRQLGFVASYILYGIGLLAIVGAAYGRLNTSNQQGKIVQDTVDEVVTQLDIITGKIMLCGAVYPDGDHGQFSTRQAYPAPATVGNQASLSIIECPGAPTGLKTMAAMPDGIPIPIAPRDFNEWLYEHTATDGIRLRLAPRITGGAEAVRTRLLRRLEGSIEADSDELVFTIMN